MEYSIHAPKSVPVLPKEIDLARFLLENRGRVITRDELLLKVWEYPCAGLQTRTVDNYVMKLRQKVEPDPARHALYREKHALYQQLYPALKPVLGSL